MSKLTYKKRKENCLIIVIPVDAPHPLSFLSHKKKVVLIRYQIKCLLRNYTKYNSKLEIQKINKNET